MPIKAYKPPPESLKALREAVEDTPKAYDHVAQMMREVLDDLDHHWPHPVYVAGLRDMASSNGMRKAEMIGWRYLARSGADRNYAIEVQNDLDGDGEVMGELDKGPYIDGIYRVLEDKEIARLTATETYRVAVIRINAMNIFAVWLTTGDLNKGIIIPIPPVPAYLKPWKTYSVKEFETVLQPEARRRLESQRFRDA